MPKLGLITVSDTQIREILSVAASERSDVMSPNKSRDLLVPAADLALGNLKLQVAQDLGIPSTGNQQQFEEYLNSWKYEVASELGLGDMIQSIGWANMSSRDNGSIGGRMGGKIGGNMVRRMIEFAEHNLR